MLDRIKNNLIIMVMGMLMVLPAFAIESTISYIAINDSVYYDVEILLNDSKEILVPFKQLADLFEINYTANRIDKQITFTTFDGKSGLINKDGVFVNEQKIQISRPIFLQQGIMDNVINEAYISADSANQLFGVKIETDYSSLTLNATTERQLASISSGANRLDYDDTKPHAHQDVILPKQNGIISLNKIGLQHSSLSDNMSHTYQNHKSINDTYNGNTILSILGNAFGGKYRIEANEYHYRNNAFIFGGLSATYMNNFVRNKTGDKYFYELGKVTGRSDVDAQIGTTIFGAQIWDYDYDKLKPNQIKGYVKPTSLVRVTFDENEPILLDTYSGFYSLADIQVPKNLKNLKIEEVNEDGTIELIKEEVYSLYGDRPFEKENRNSVYAGVWGYQNRLFRDGAHIYRGYNKKATVGADYQYGIKDNVTFESRLTGDKIYDKTGTSVYYRLPTNDTLLLTGTQKNVNYLEGATTLNSVEYVSEKDPNFKARATAGASIAHDVREENTKFGYTGKLRAEYNMDLHKYAWKFFHPRNASAKLDLFHNSEDFYIASTDSTSYNGRTGGRASGGFGFNNTSVNGGYSKYFSNLNHKYKGGTIEFDQFNINAGTKIPKVVDVKFNTYYKKGENDLGWNENYNYDFNLSRDLNKWAFIRAGVRENGYMTRYHKQTAEHHSFDTNFRDIYIAGNVPIPGNHGKFQIGHNFIKYSSSGYRNNYNMFKFGYVFPEWKRLTLGLGWGFRYAGQGGHDLNVNLGYRAQSGQMMQVGYQYSKLGGYFIDNMFTPMTNRHSVNFVFNDAFQVFHRGLKSIGDEFENEGIFEAIAFIDINKNGTFDKNVDIPLKNIPINTSWSAEPIYTNKAGRVCSATLTSGTYKISLDMNNLPITVAPLSNDLISKTVRIEDGLTTKLELPLVSTVGSVSGVLKITDDFERDFKITDFIVVLLDENGEEVTYSTVADTGEFYISGIAPGKYILKLDPRFISAYGLEELPEISERRIFIPYDYNNPTDIEEQNLEYKTMAL